MFLSPILILALLFSSCDDNSGKAPEKEPAPAETTKVTVSGTGATLSGTEEASGSLTVNLAEADSVTPEGSKGSIKIELTSSTQATVTSDSLELPNASLKDGEITIEASSTDGYALGSETIEKVKITGTYATEGTTLTITKVELTKKAEEAPAAVTLKLTGASITATGMSDETGAVTTSAAPDTVTGASDTSSIASSSLTVTIGSAADSTVSGNITLAESKTLADLSGLTALVFNNVQIGGTGTKYNMTLTGTAYTGSGDWTITGITFAAAGA